MALKKAELSDEIIVRVVETDGRAAENVHLTFAAPIVGAREVNGQEQPIGSATVSGGELVTALRPYQLRTFAIKLAQARTRIPPVQSQPVMLEHDLSVASRVGRPADGSFDWAPNNQNASQGRALPAEMLPREINYAGIRFQLAAAAKPNATIARGQAVALPAGKFNRAYILAAATNGDQKGAFRVGDKTVELNIQEWTGFIGQWDNRIWKSAEEIIRPTGTPANAPVRTRLNPYAEMTGLKPGYIKRADIGWFSSQRHNMDGSSEPYAYSYLFVYVIDLPPGAQSLTLPDNERIRIMALTVADEPWIVKPAQPLYDTLERE
jgi:alpha-mannosidase